MRDDHILALATGQGLDKVWGEDGGWIGSAERTELKSSNSLTGEGGVASSTPSPSFILEV